MPISWLKSREAGPTKEKEKPNGRHVVFGLGVGAPSFWWSLKGNQKENKQFGGSVREKRHPNGYLGVYCG